MGATPGLGRIQVFKLSLVILQIGKPFREYSRFEPFLPFWGTSEVSSPTSEALA